MLSSNLSQREFLFFLKASEILPLKLKSYYGFLSNQWSIYSKREQRLTEEKVQIQSFVVSFKYYAHRLIKLFSFLFDWCYIESGTILLIYSLSEIKIVFLLPSTIYSLYVPRT